MSDLDEASRPSAPRDDTPVSETGRRVGEHLVEVHDMYRAELDQVVDVLEQLRTGRTSVDKARGDLQRIALLANNWAFGVHLSAVLLRDHPAPRTGERADLPAPAPQ